VPFPSSRFQPSCFWAGLASAFLEQHEEAHGTEITWEQQCDSQKDLRFAIVRGLKLIDEVSMSSKLKTGYYHLFLFFSTKIRGRS